MLKFPENYYGDGPNDLIEKYLNQSIIEALDLVKDNLDSGYIDEEYMEYFCPKNFPVKWFPSVFKSFITK